MELAGSWQISQLTAERWVAQAERFCDALPTTLAMLAAGTLLRHQASTLLHRTSMCSPQIAGLVEAEVLPGGADLCPSDLGRKIDRVRLRITSEQTVTAEAERQEAEKIASRRTFARPTEDAMVLAGAVLTPEQGVAWAVGMDALERRERLADRAAGICRTAEQRRADLFAALPALVLAGTARDDAHRRAAGQPTGGRIGAPRPGEGEPPPSPGPRSPGRSSSGPCWSEPLFDTGVTPDSPWTFSPEQVAAQVVFNIHVPVSTVLELSKEPGSLDRYGPVSAEHIRLLRPTSFRRVMSRPAPAGRSPSMTGPPRPTRTRPRPASRSRRCSTPM